MKESTNTEQVILEAAEREFLDKGYALSKTVGIAKRAGVNHAMLHYYFRTKENLFDKVFQRKIILLTNSFMSSIEDELPFIEKVEYVIKAHFDFMMSNPKLPFFIVNEFLTNKNRLDKFSVIADPVIKDILKKLETEMKASMKRGEICSVDPAHLLLDIISLNTTFFVTLPIIERVTYLFEGKYDLFLNEKRKENVELILKRLRP